MDVLVLFIEQYNDGIIDHNNYNYGSKLSCPLSLLPKREY